MAKGNKGLSELEKVRGKTLKRNKDLKKKFFPTAYLNDEIEILDKNLEKYIQLQKHYCEYYHHQRLDRKNRISEIIESHLIDDFEIDTMWRVVGHQFSQDPLCTVGSIFRPPGGRFNFGKGLEGYEKFHCLYLGDSAQTCLSEKFHTDEQYNDEKISKEFLSLQIDESHSTFRIKCSLENVIDLRDDKFIDSFLGCIKDISVPEELNKFSRSNGWSESYPINDAKKLKSSLLEENYTLSGITYGLPSNSQWLGYHCYNHGVQAIIYPSARAEDGFNIAIFIDNLKDSNLSYIQLYDEVKYITADRRIINKSNVDSFKNPEKI